MVVSNSSPLYRLNAASPLEGKRRRQSGKQDSTPNSWENDWTLKRTSSTSSGTPTFPNTSRNVVSHCFPSYERSAGSKEGTEM